MLTLLPLLILWVLVKILPPWVEKENAPAEAAVSAMAARS
jgi:hypothetical protein